MPSIFSLLRRDTTRSSPESSGEPTVRQPTTVTNAPAPTISRSLNAASNSPSHEAYVQVLDILDEYLPSGVSVVSMNERPVGIGNRRGTDTTGGFAVVALKGIQLDVLVRFQVLADAFEQAEDVITSVQDRLLRDRNVLQAKHLLRIVLQNTSPTEFMSASNVWRKTTEYHILYEHHYYDTDEAESLIARIPIHADPEFRNSIERETTVVTNDFVRWDERGAPALIVRGRARINNLSALAFVPGTSPTGLITLVRTFDGAPDTPTIYTTLKDFFSAVTGSSPDRNACVTFASLNDFLAALDAGVGLSDREPLALGDWNEDGTPDLYEPHTFEIQPAIQLIHPTDRFEINYQSASFDRVAVVYLRAKRG